MPAGIVAYNPTAGRFPSRKLAERAAGALRLAGWSIHLEETANAEHITRIARQAAEDRMEAFFIAGGDGSVSCAMAGLIGSQTALGVLPAGTSNVFAKELGLPVLSWTRRMALEESACLLAAGEARRVDVGYCNEKPFLLWAGSGLDALIVHRLEPRSRWEKQFAVISYAASAVWYAAFWGGMDLEAVVDGSRVQGHYLLALVSNVDLYAGGLFHLSPDTRLDDGLMDLWLFEGETLGDTLRLVLDLFAGRHAHSRGVCNKRFKCLTLAAATPLYLQLDGEPVVGPNQTQVTVLPRALRVLVPKNSRR